MRASQVHKTALLCRNKLVVKEEKHRRMTPSIFTQEMLQSTDERLNNTIEVHLPRILEQLHTSNAAHHKLSSVKMDQPLFQPYPSELIFQNYLPSQTYKLSLLLFNNDKVSQQVKLEQQDSEQFHVVGPEEAVSKVAPGMFTTFTVIFTPQENKDYNHRLVCVTERERFEIPIYAIGPRAILDFRDEISLPVCAVKSSTQKTHLVRNIGNCKAKFKLHTERPFSVTPSSGSLDVGESMQVTVDFQPTSVGDHQQDLLLHYHTGEDVYISLYGFSEELNIHLEPDYVVLKKTYVTLANVHTVSLTNRSNIPLKYCWTLWRSQQEEDQSLLWESSVIQQGKEEEEKGQWLFQSEPPPTVIHHPPLLSRSQPEYRPAKDYLSLSSITLEPAEGEIWPNTTAKFHILFKPDEAKLYQYNVYCDVTGRQSRLPLTIKGEGLGPQLELNYHLMDMKNVFIDDKDIYEVQMSNTGLIDAPFRFSSPDTTFGRCFSFSPEEGVVPPGACQIVEVTFHSRVLGTFSEDLLITVTGQPQPLTLTFRGCVIGPTFHFNVYGLNFGDVAFGFPATLFCTLFNTSYVPMTFALRILGDGLGSPSVTSAKQVSDLSRKTWQGHAARDLHTRPVEFTVSPAVGYIRAMSDETIKVTLCANTVGRYKLAMAVDVEGVGEEIMTLPINARCVVPKIMVEPPLLDFQRCFLGHPYEQQVLLTNPSNLPACYGLLVQETEESPSLVFSSSVPRGVLLPGSSAVLPVSLVVKSVGRIQHSLHIAVFGSPQQPLEVILTCIGQGPVVHLQSTQLNFDQIPVLTDVSKTLQLVNQSPIPAHFTTCMSQRRSSWRVEPSEGKIPPESQLELKVVAHLKDTVYFQDELAVSIQDSQTHIVSLSARGTGTTVVSDRPFGPSLDLGTHFSLCRYCFKLTNHGKRIHRLYWKTEGLLSFTTKRKGGSLSGRTILPPISTSRQRGTLSGGSLPPSSREKPAFSLSPSRAELPPGSSVDMVLTVSSDIPKVVHERLVCHGIIGPQGCQETIMTVDVTCRFVTPVLSFSSKQLNFYIEKVKGESLMPQYEKLILKNESSLSLSMELSLVEPFFMCDARGDHESATTKSIVLGDRHKAELWICFDPAFYQDQVSRIVDELLEVRYLGHTQKDFVELHAEVHYPNLHFSTSTVDFGCVYNYTETRKVITITNCSPLPVSYHWSFLVDHKHTDRDTTFGELGNDQMSLESDTEERPCRSSTLSPAFSLPPSLRPKNANEQSCLLHLVRVEEVFDISPMYGLLQPGDQQLITFLFFGHENVSKEVVAQCHVEEGPLYKIQLRGEASVINYSLESTHLDFGQQLFYSVREVEVTLKNTGKVGFKFSIVYPQRGEEKLGEEEEVQIMALEKKGELLLAQQCGVKEKYKEEQNIRPGWPMVIPAVGYIDAGSDQCLRVLYLPGIPEVFEKHLQLQVAFLPAQEITLTGEGVFPRISLNLPRNLDDCSSDTVQQARAAVEAERVTQELLDGNTATMQATCLLTYTELFHLEIERLLVKENALAVYGSLLEQSDSQWYKLSKFELPEFVLDFGFVIPGKVNSKTVNVTNSGSIPVSFQAICKHLAGTGFSVELRKVKNLPCGETQPLIVKFDPRGANLKMGDTSIVLPIQVAGGPVVQVRLCAVVTMPAITVSAETVQFDRVQCGMCQIKTIELLNPESVPCYWSIAEEVKPFKKVDKFLPLYERKRILQEQRPPAVVFEMVPCSGVLFPGEQVNVHVKFSPDKGCEYNRRLEVRVADNTQKVFITAQGHGEEPQLEFCPSVLVLGPCLPLSTETEAEVTVKNPCSFPIEFYSLEFDTEYLEEEKILRLMQGYDDNNTLLLPPRVPGEGLPTELLDYYKDCCSKMKDDELNEGLDSREVKKEDTLEEDKKSNQNKISRKNMKQAEIFVSELSKEACSGRLGELEMTPVFRAIARHMGFDLSPEGLAARNSRGIAIVVYGAPLTDKSSIAASLAHHYGAVCLNVDAVITDVLQNGSSPVSLAAKQLYLTAAAEYAQKRAAETAQAGEDTRDAEHAGPLEALDPNSVPVSVDSVEVSAKHKESNGREDDSAEAEHRRSCFLGDVPTLHGLLPEPLLADILAERFQLSDCHRGVVIDGLESVYTQFASNTLQVVLRALSNLKHIYVVNLSDSYAALMARRRVQREAEEALQKETAEREEKWLQDLDDSGYETLSAEEKARVIQWHLETRRKQKLRELEQMEKEQEQKRHEEEEAKRLKEDLKKKNKKGGKKDIKEAPKNENLLEGKQRSVCSNSKDIHMDSREQLNLNEVHHGKKADDSQNQLEETKTLTTESPQSTDKLEKEKCIVDELQSKFNDYEQNSVQVEHVLQHWDRVQGVLLVPFPSEETLPGSDDASTEKQSPAGKKNKKGNSKTLSPLPSETVETVHKAGDKVSPTDVIPHIVLNLTEKESWSPTVLLGNNALPPLDEVLDDLGLGPGGPPIPSPITFSVVSFPAPRVQADVQQTCFTFLVPSGLDKDSENKSLEEDMQESYPKKESVAASKSYGKGRSKESSVSKDKDKKAKESLKSGKEAHKSKIRTPSKTEIKTTNESHSPFNASSTSNVTDQDHHEGNLETKRSQSLATFRWVVPANGEMVLKIWFYSESPGIFEQVFNFELAGTRKLFQLTCRGICTYPSICKNYMTIFAHSKKVTKMKEGAQKAYVIRQEYFEFGPLLCSKTRDRYKESRYPENSEKLLIHNNSGLEAEVQFSFQHDTKATTYLLDPPSMTLSPDQKQELTLWAYPTKQEQMKDCVICHIKDNPEPVIINVSCWGVRPEIELESRHLNFGKVLLHRRDSRSVTMHNKTALPVSWRLRGVEELGDEFVVPKDQGIIPPYSSFLFSMIFRPIKPLHVKKILRLEVSDVGKILGILQTENIQVVAEAYDIDLEITPDGSLNFGTIKVFEEAKLSLKLKNKGKYDLAFKFSFKQTEPALPNLDSIFIVSPKSGSLSPHEKPTVVLIICRPDREVTIKEQPILPCQVIEPSIGKEGETIATLNIKVSIQSLFSRYKITPACDINFGPLVCGCKKSQSFTIENTGHFELCFDISCMNMDPALPARLGGPGKMAPKETSSSKPACNSLKARRETLQKDSSIQQNRLTFSVFSVFPCNGNVHPGSRQLVTVDCVAEQLGSWNQSLLIHLSGCNPLDHSDAVQYRLLAEVCKPGIVLDMASIFEEHYLCQNSSLLSSEQFHRAESIYVLDENKFLFNKVLVGRTAQARFRLTNKSKVLCTLNLAIRYVGAKTSRNMEVFDLCETTLSIASQSHAFAIVTFTPQTMQQYSAVFEATMEGLDRLTPTFKNKVLEFDIIGEGTLPSVCVVRPALRSSGGSPMLMFRRVLVGRRYTLPLVLLNDGNVPAQVQIDMLDKHGVFAIKCAPGNTCSSIYSTHLNDPAALENQLVHRATVTLNVNEPGRFEVIFCSKKPLNVKAKISVQVKDNQYSNATIQVTGEAYQEIITLDNIRRSLQDVDQEEEREGNYEVLHFGDCHVDCPYQESFTMTNHSSNQVVRFEWPPSGPHVAFSPQVGHLHAGCSKEVTVTFRSSQPVTLSSQPMKCKVCQVEFQQPIDQVPDWDDRQKMVEWQSLDEEASQQLLTNKVIETDPEPSCSVVDGSVWELDLRVNAICDYVKFSCSTNTIHFKDTMLFQTRLHQLQIMNVGSVKVEFSWQVFMDPSSSKAHHDKRDVASSPRPGSRSAGSLQEARPSSALASVMCLLMGNPESPPFSVEPSIGIIDPGVTQTFSVRFSPMEVALFEGRLICSIPNLQDGNRAPCIPLFGRGLLPHCHFDLEDSDYISCNRRDPQFGSPLDPNTRVLEFKAVGLSVPLTRCFGVVNPTSSTYSFKWKCENKSVCHFRCLTPYGSIQPGKKVEVSFEYLPEQQDTVESLWSFVIETLPLTVPFLLVGTVREPIVYIDRPHLDFGELLVGHKVEQKVDLVNGEEEHVHFSVIQSSLLSEEQQSSLILQPISGTVAPRDKLSLSVSFTPTREGHVSFRAILKVKRKSEPLVLTVKADCFAMTALVQVEQPNGGLRDVSSDHQDTLDFEEVGISEKSTINLLVSNLARFMLEVDFELTGPRELLQHLETKPQTATIDVGKQLHSSLFFSPQSICSLQDVKLNVKVKLGPIFTFNIKGQSVAPNVEFSFNKFNFGKCFLCCYGSKPPSQTLVISNKGKRDISIHCQFENTKHLEVDFQSDVLSAGAAISVPVTFHPHEACRYHEKLIFVLNSCITKQVDVLGQGIELKLEVGDPRQKQVKLGSLTLGQKVKKHVVLVNRSSVDLHFTLIYTTNTLLDPKDLSISPTGQLKLKSGGGSCKVEIQFSPGQHTPPFTAELQATFPGFFHPLLTIQGCCQGVEVQLDPNHLSFGAVVQRCQTSKRIVMMNTGDIGARFHWKTEHFPSELSITPTKGYICPGMEIPFEVTFAPSELSNDIRYESLSCLVQGSSSAVRLTVTGSCITASTSKEVVNFTCPVRSSHTQSVSVLNPTNQHCSIKPVIEGDQWRTAVLVSFEPHQNKTVNITYKPLSMTADGKKHQGSVFFSFPDGKGMFYFLHGTSLPPKPEDNVVRELPAKTRHSELLAVTNGLSRQQRFRVLIEMLKPDKPDATTSLKGLKQIDLPAQATKDFTLSFFAYKEGQYNTKVTFLNEATGEYLFYLVTFKVTPPGVLSTIELVTPVRRTTSATIQVENPLTTATCLTTECKCPDISGPPQHTVPGQSMGVLSFEYHPLQEGQSTVRLSLFSNDLGHFHYDLLLKALPPSPEKTVHFNASLGSSHSIHVKFINYSRFKTEYSCKTDCPDFIVDRNVSASPGFPSGSESGVEVCFEPHQLGEVIGQLRLSSGHAGEYVVPLHGVCLPPKAQGPFSIKAGRTMTIPFKNVFLQTTTFSCQVDNSCFTVKGVDSIPSKRTQNILVSFEAPSGESPGPWFGKLTISSQRSEGDNKACTWIYYLKGHRPESS